MEQKQVTLRELIVTLSDAKPEEVVAVSIQNKVRGRQTPDEPTTLYQGKNVDEILNRSFMLWVDSKGKYGGDGYDLPHFNFWTRRKAYFTRCDDENDYFEICGIPRNPCSKMPLTLN